MTTDRYTIRLPGRASWGTTNDKAEAVRLYREAKDRLNEEPLIYDEQQQRAVYPDDLLPPVRPDDV